MRMELNYLFYSSMDANTSTTNTTISTITSTDATATTTNYTTATTVWVLLGMWVLGGAKKITVFQGCLATKKQDLPCYSTRF